MSEKITIRKAARKDLPAVYRLIAEATKNGKILKRPLSELKKCMRTFYVAVEGETVVGCCAIAIYNKKLAEIRSLAVNAKRQRLGLASLLVKECLIEAKKKRIYEVLVITDRQNLFKRLGFAEQLHGQKPLFLRPKRS